MTERAAARMHAFMAGAPGPLVSTATRSPDASTAIVRIGVSFISDVAMDAIFPEILYPL
jgi:hypothetical protein